MQNINYQISPIYQAIRSINTNSVLNSGPEGNRTPYAEMPFRSFTGKLQAQFMVVCLVVCCYVLYWKIRFRKSMNQVGYYRRIAKGLIAMPLKWISK